MLIQEQQLKTFKEIFYSCSQLLIFTGRYEAVAKVMFLLVSVILLTRGGACLSACWDTTPQSRHPREQNPQEKTPPPQEQTPPGQTPCLSACWDTTPPGADTPREQTPWSRYHLWEQTRPREQTPPPSPEQTPAYGQWAAGTHCSSSDE